MNSQWTVCHRCICSAYIPYIIFLQAWTYNEQTYEKGIKEAYGKDSQSKIISIGNLLNARLLHMKESKKYYYYGWGIQIKMLCMFLMI